MRLNYKIPHCPSERLTCESIWIMKMMRLTLHHSLYWLTLNYSP